MQFVERICRVVSIVVLAAMLCSSIASPVYAGKKGNGKKEQKHGKKKSKPSGPSASQKYADAWNSVYQKAATIWKQNAEARLPGKEANVEAARQRYLQSVSELESLARSADAGKAKLEGIQQRILAAAGADSAFARAKKRCDETRAAFVSARDRVLTSPNYLTNYNAAKNGPDAAARLPKVRQDALANDDAYRAAEGKYHAAETIFNQAKTELFAADPEWEISRFEMRMLLAKIGEAKEFHEAHHKQMVAASLSASSLVVLINKAADRIASLNVLLRSGNTKSKYVERSNDIRQDSGSDK